MAEDIFGPDIGSLKARQDSTMLPWVHWGLCQWHPCWDYGSLPWGHSWGQHNACKQNSFLCDNLTLHQVWNSWGFAKSEITWKAILSAIKKVQCLHEGWVSNLGSPNGWPVWVLAWWSGCHGNPLNIVANNKHVLEIEHYIRTMKEHMRCV